MYYQILKKRISASREIEEIKTMMENSFPKEEQTDIAKLQQLSLREYVNFDVYYANNDMCGFSFIVKNKNFIFLYYLVIKDCFRSLGIGTKILNSIISSKDKKIVILNIEPLDINALNNSQRKKRLNFYLENGLINTGYFLYHENIEYLILASEQTFNIVEYKSLLIDLSESYRDCKLYKK